jgi:hypothetical protein
VRRRFIDRLLSLILPVHRYRCNSLGCHWEGNLRQKAPCPAEHGAAVIATARRIHP